MVEHPIFLATSPEILGQRNLETFEKWFQAGDRFAAIHAIALCLKKRVANPGMGDEGFFAGLRRISAVEIEFA